MGSGDDHQVAAGGHCPVVCSDHKLRSSPLVFFGVALGGQILQVTGPDGARLLLN